MYKSQHLTWDTDLHHRKSSSRGPQEKSTTPLVPQQAGAASAPGDPSHAALPGEHLPLDQPPAWDRSHGTKFHS